jgi:hypothetical protein
MDPTGPIQIVLAVSTITAVAEIALDRPTEGHTRRARLFDLLGWLIFVCWAGVVLWQIRRVIVSDVDVEEEVNLVAPIVSVVLAIPIYSLVILPLQRLLNLGEFGERVLRLVVALVFGLALQEIAVRLGLFPRP